MNELDDLFSVAVRRDDAVDASKLDPPRWPGGPPICKRDNLPAFKSIEAALEWHEGKNKRGNPLYEANHITKIGLCPFCHHYHFTAQPKGPSGSSSGSARGDWHGRIIKKYDWA